MKADAEDSKCLSCKTDLLPPRYKGDKGLCRKCFNLIKNNKCPNCGGNLKEFSMQTGGFQTPNVTRWEPRKGCPPCGNIYPYIYNKDNATR